MSKKLVELKTTDGQTIHVKPEAVGAIEIVPASQRVEGHIKIYVAGFKFLVKEEPEALIKKLDL